DFAAGVAVNLDATAFRAEGSAAVVIPADRLERLERFILAHAHDLRQRERPGLGREEEVLRHCFVAVFVSYVSNIATSKPLVNSLCVEYDDIYCTSGGVLWLPIRNGRTRSR